MTTVQAGACLLGSAEVRRMSGDDALFVVPAYELLGVAPQAIRLGDVLEIPPSVEVDPALRETHLRVVGRNWRLRPTPDQPEDLVWLLVLLCCDADPDETDRRYLASRYRASKVVSFWPARRPEVPTCSS